jgi:hypothetical protein
VQLNYTDNNEVNMIRKSDILKATSIQYDTYEQDLLFNVLHEHYLSTDVEPLKYVYIGRYGKSMSRNMIYEVKFFV